jgi:hypothetical protein
LSKKKSDSIRYGKDGREYFLGIEIFGWLPMLAGLAIATSSVTVVGNSLGRYRPRLAKKPLGEELHTNDDLKANSLHQASRKL